MQAEFLLPRTILESGDAGRKLLVRTPRQIRSQASDEFIEFDGLEQWLQHDGVITVDKDDDMDKVLIHPDALGHFTESGENVFRENKLYAYVQTLLNTLDDDTTDPRLSIESFSLFLDELFIRAQVERPDSTRFTDRQVEMFTGMAMAQIAGELGLGAAYGANAIYSRDRGLSMTMSPHSHMGTEGESYTPTSESLSIVSNNVIQTQGRPLIFLGGLIAFAKPELILE